MTTKTEFRFDVEGMTCGTCAARVQRVLSRVPGVVDASVNFAMNQASVRTDEGGHADHMIDAVRKIGYGLAESHDDSHGGHEHLSPVPQVARRLVVSAITAAPLLVLHMVPGLINSLGHRGHQISAWLGLGLAGVALAYGGWPFIVSAVKRTRHLQTNMDTLIALGTLTAYFYSVAALSRRDYHDVYFEVTATIITLILLGKFLEARAINATSSAVRKLLELGAKQARVQRGQDEAMVSVGEVVPGDILIVKPGEKVAVDAVVVEGSSAVDESMMTGESVPVDKVPGDSVFGATLNHSGLLLVRATKTGESSALAEIVGLVQNALSSRAPVQRLVDRISEVFVPAVMAIALTTMVVMLMGGATWESSILRAVAVIVIACPCAMGLATPVAVMAGTGRGAQRGVFLRSAEVLEASGKVNTVILDKTGTITEGKMTVAEIVAADGFDEPSLLRAVGSLESASEHPIGKAIAEHARSRGLSLITPTEFQAHSGAGAVGFVEGQSVKAGKMSLLAVESLPDLESRASSLAAAGHTTIFAAIDGRAAGVIALSDRPRAGAPEAVRKLHAMNVDVVMLTGDNTATAERVASEVGIDTVFAEMLPKDKVDVVARLQREGRTVAMVGDGINDAPALTQADLGVAVGAGTDVAIEASDITVVSEDPAKIPEAISLARKTMAVIKQNLFWAFGYNVAAIPLAVIGKASPSIAGAAMAASSLSVVGNALRLRKAS